MMKYVQGVISLIGERLKALAQKNVVVSKPVSLGTRHVLTLCELRLSFGGGGGSGEGEGADAAQGGQGTGGGAGGSAKATPVAVIVADGRDVRIAPIGH